MYTVERSHLERNMRRQPIQLQPDVKQELDKVRVELMATLHGTKITQSSAISYLIRFYRENSQKQQV